MSELGNQHPAPGFAGCIQEVTDMRRWFLLALAGGCAAALSVAAQAADWRLTTGGYGPARIGMSVAEAAQALGLKLEPLGLLDEPICYYAAPDPAIDGLTLMISKDRVVRFDVDKPGVVTKSGLGIGDTEAHILEVLGKDAVEVTPHKYTGPQGHYLTVWSADRKFALRFETDGAKVTRFYAGRLPEATYVEGCS